jgi:hypothetical protein
MADSNSNRQDRRERNSALVSLLLLAGLGVGGAGFFSQHYRIEFVPKGQNLATAPQKAVPGSAVHSTGVAAVEPEVILVDGCDFADEEPVLTRLPARFTPRTQLKASRQQAAQQPCDEELPADITKTGSSAPGLALLSTLTEYQDDPALGLPTAVLATSVIDAGGYPPNLGAPATPDMAGSPYLPGLSTLGGGGGSLPGGGITSLPAQENSDRPLSAPTSELLNTPLPGTSDPPDTSGTPGTTTASVPEPGSLALLGVALLGTALARRRRALTRR